MTEVVRVRRVALRHPFAVRSLPPLARLFRAAKIPRTRTHEKVFVGLPLQLMHRVLHRAGMGGEGEFAVRRDGADIPVRFAARNTQFSSLYLSQFRQGYEPETAALIDALLVDAGTFYDVGSNWGHFSLFAATRPDFSGRVLAFEPMPGTYRDLVRTVEQAGLAATITPHHFALSDTDDEGRMAMPGAESGLATIREDADASGSGEPAGSGGTSRPGGTTIQRRRLDALDLPPPDVMKVDAEDHEEQVFAGGRETLAEHRPHIVFESWRNHRDPAVTLGPLRRLEALGYSFFQPAFVRGPDASPFFVGYGHHQEVPAEVDLALVPLLAARRMLLDDQINILAVHADRLPELEALFGRRMESV